MNYNLSVVNHQIKITVLKNYQVFSITLQKNVIVLEDGKNTLKYCYFLLKIIIYSVINEKTI